MASIKHYKVKATWFNDAEVQLRVDHDVLTSELASLINNFWSSSDSRLADEKDDPVRTVIRMFGERAISHFMSDGGIDVIRESWAERITQEVIDAQGEGWPDADGLGILLVDGYVPTVGYDDVELEEV